MPMADYIRAKDIWYQVNINEVDCKLAKQLWSVKSDPNLNVKHNFLIEFKL